LREAPGISLRSCHRGRLVPGSGVQGTVRFNASGNGTRTCEDSEWRVWGQSSGRKVWKKSYVNIIETTQLLSLIWKNLEAHWADWFHWSGSIWKLTELTDFTDLEESGSSLSWLFSLFYSHCFTDSSKTVKTVLWSRLLCGSPMGS